MGQIVSVIVFGVLALGFGAAVFRTKSMVRSALALLGSMAAVGGLFLGLEAEFLGVLQLMMMATEMTIMAIFMVMYMMDPGRCRTTSPLDSSDWPPHCWDWPRAGLAWRSGWLLRSRCLLRVASASATAGSTSRFGLPCAWLARATRSTASCTPRGLALADSDCAWRADPFSRTDAFVESAVQAVGHGGLVLARAGRRFDETELDGLIAQIVQATRALGAGARRLQSGFVSRELVLAACGAAVVFLIALAVRYAARFSDHVRPAGRRRAPGSAATLPGANRSHDRADHFRPEPARCRSHWLRGAAPGFSQVEEIAWIPSLGSAYRVGVDGLSVPLVLLTTVLFFVSLVFSVAVRERATAYVAFFLMLETTCLGAFVALDLVLFYVFFELTLVAMYFIIAGWGHADRQRAALLFFLYTLLGSLPILLGIVALYLDSNPHTFDLRQAIVAPPLTGLTAALTFLAFLIGFGIKTPVFPFHTWLPAAHVEAPTAGSVVLAGVLLKLGTYGFVRFALQMTPDAFRAAAPWVAALAVVSALYGAFVALAQTDLKRLVAYTSVNHMGYVVLAVAAGAAATEPRVRSLAIDGAVLQMVSHGVVTGALFLLVGALQDRAGTREMGAFGGLLRAVPLLGWGFIVAAFASLGLPGLAHFPAEFQIFLGAFGVWPVAAAVTVLGIVITAGLYLRAIQMTFLGELGDRWRALPDLGRSDLWAIGPLLLLALLIGVVPGGLLDVIHRTTSSLGP